MTAAEAWQRASQSWLTIRAINKRRVAKGLPKLRLDKDLRRAAQAHSDAMSRGGYFSHYIDGTPNSRIIKARYVHGTNSWYIGENIGWGTGSWSTPGHIVGEWMRSPEHRAIILTERFRDIGIGIAPYKGGLVYTADFGRKH